MYSLDVLKLRKKTMNLKINRIPKYFKNENACIQLDAAPNQIYDFSSLTFDFHCGFLKLFMANSTSSSDSATISIICIH